MDKAYSMVPRMGNRGEVPPQDFDKLEKGLKGKTVFSFFIKSCSQFFAYGLTLTTWSD